MKTRITTRAAIVLTVAMFFIAVCVVPVNAQQKTEPVKIGTYDSRIVTLAFSRSEHFKKITDSFKEADPIMQQNDTAKKIQAFYKIFTKQFLLHQQVFCSGSSAYVLDFVKDQLPQLAKETGTIAIVSKWELTYLDPTIEIVDLTLPVSKLFNPTADFDRMVPEFEKQAPIPLQDFTIEEVVEAWKQFETKYLGKK